jgi:hypothetical protein
MLPPADQQQAIFAKLKVFKELVQSREYAQAKIIGDQLVPDLEQFSDMKVAIGETFADHLALVTEKLAQEAEFNAAIQKVPLPPKKEKEDCPPIPEMVIEIPPADSGEELADNEKEIESPEIKSPEISLPPKNMAIPVENLEPAAILDAFLDESEQQKSEKPPKNDPKSNKTEKKSPKDNKPKKAKKAKKVKEIKEKPQKEPKTGKFPWKDYLRSCFLPQNKRTLKMSLTVVGLGVVIGVLAPVLPLVIGLGLLIVEFGLFLGLCIFKLKDHPTTSPPSVTEPAEIPTGPTALPMPASIQTVKIIPDQAAYLDAKHSTSAV